MFASRGSWCSCFTASLIDDDDSGGDLDLDAFSFAQFVQNQAFVQGNRRSRVGSDMLDADSRGPIRVRVQECDNHTFVQ